jgi:hypothetical protein
MAAAIILLLGIFGADAAYWLGTRSADLSGDPSVVGYDKTQVRQMGILYGKQALWIEEWRHKLKHPGPQACVILAASVLAAGGCFYFARLLDAAGESGHA